MNKQTKTLLGVALVAGVGYYLWMQNKKKSEASFANFDIKNRCLCHTEELDGVYLCGDGKSLARNSGGKCRGAGTGTKKAMQ